MADNQTGLNAQYDPGSGPFGIGIPKGTGAPGSPGVSASDTYGAVIASPVVSVPGASSQVDANMPRVPVTQGDTLGISSDSVVPAGGDPLTGLSLAQVISTGAGQGHADHFRHPDAMGGGQ